MDLIIEVKHERAVELVEKVARFISERHLAPAAIIFIESFRPLHRIGSQFLYFIAPFAEVIFKPKEYQEFAALLEKDEYIELLSKRIDEIDTELHEEERKRKRLLRKRRFNEFKLYVKKVFGKHRDK